MNKYYILTALLIIGIVSFIGTYNYINKGHEDLNLKKSEVEVSALELVTSYVDDEIKSNDLFLNKIIDVSGRILEAEETEGRTNIRLKVEDDMYGVICEMSSQEKKIDHYQKGDSVLIRGLCTGMLLDVVLVRAVVINKF